MQIDWITVSAQIVNFLILVWLLRRFLYRPVLRAMDKREQRIAGRLEEAREREEQAGEEIRRYRDMRGELDAVREISLAEAREDAEQLKREMLDDAREEVAEIRTNWLQQVREEREEFLGNLRRESAGAVEALARKALRDLAESNLEERILHNFIGKLRRLDSETREAMANHPGPFRVTTAFELEPAQRHAIADVIHEVFGADAVADYAVAGDLLCGIELASGGHLLGWNLAAYMDEMADRIEKALEPAGTAGVEA